MNDLPRGPLGPLDPPPGAFEAVQRRAGRRKLQRAGVAGALSVALLAGAFGIGSALGGTSEPDALVVVSSAPSVESSYEEHPEKSPLPSPSAVPSPTSAPAVLPTLRPEPSPSPAATDAPPQPWVLTVQDTAGRPVAGAFLHAVYSSGQVVATGVGTDGRLEVDCDGARYLVAMWDLTNRSQPAGQRNLAAAWVQGGTSFETAGDVGCYLSDEQVEVTTVLREGGTLTGAMRYVDPQGQESSYGTGSNPGGGLYCRALGLPGDQAQCADWQPVDGRYRFTGLPSGTYRLQGMYGWRDVEVRAGRTSELDWYECDGCTGGSAPQPAPSPTP